MVFPFHFGPRARLHVSGGEKNGVRAYLQFLDTLIWDDTAWVRRGRGEREEWERRKDGEEKEERYREL